MIITRTPYRVSFFGGGTDFPAFYQEHRGAVISSSINRYSHIQCRILPPYFDHNYRIRYYQTERVITIDEIQHPSVRECIKFLNFSHPLEMLHSGDIPAMSGIGSSSAFTVGFLLALKGLSGRMASKKELAEEAVIVEQNWIKENVGSQDQYAVAFGGMNRIDFGPGNEVRVTPLIMSAAEHSYLQSNLLFCYTGIARISSEIQATHQANIRTMTESLIAMRDMTDEAEKLLREGERGIDEFGELLHEAWKLKRSFSKKVSNDGIDAIYKTAMDAGASGGKVCGAGGGGFMVFYVRPDRRANVEKALKNILIVPIKLENQGAQVIFFAHEQNEEFIKGTPPGNLRKDKKGR